MLITKRKKKCLSHCIIVLYSLSPTQGASLMAQLVKESTCNAGDPGPILGSGRSTGERIGYPLQYSRASLVAQLVKNLPANAGSAVDVGSIPGSGRSPGVGNGNPLQYACLENSLDRSSWWATVHGDTQSGTQLNMLTHTICFLQIHCTSYY